MYGNSQIYLLSFPYNLYLFTSRSDAGGYLIPRYHSTQTQQKVVHSRACCTLIAMQSNKNAWLSLALCVSQVSVGAEATVSWYARACESHLIMSDMKMRKLIKLSLLMVTQKSITYENKYFNLIWYSAMSILITNHILMQ